MKGKHRLINKYICNHTGFPVEYNIIRENEEAKQYGILSKVRK